MRKNEENQKVAVWCARKKSLTASPHKRLQASVPAIPHHIGRGWGCPNNPQGCPPLQLGQRKCASTVTSHQRAPPPVPGSSHCRPHGPRETCDEVASFIRPASADFTRQHDKARAIMLACQFWMGQLFAPSSLRQRDSINSFALAAGVAVSPTVPRGTTRQQ